MSETLRRPESVLIVVYTSAREFLLLERVQPAGFWQSVTGSLEWEETPLQAAQRELAEETGLAADGLRDGQFSQRFPILPQWRSRFADDVDSNLEHVWYLELPRRVEITLNPAEHSASVWLAGDQALARVSSWTNRDAIERLQTTNRLTK